MTRDEKRDYLKRVKVAYKLICSYEEELLEHRLIIQCAPIGCYEQIVRASGNSGNLEPAVIKILEYEEKIKSAIVKYIEIKSICLDAIEKLTDDIGKLALRLHYINGKTITEMCDILHYGETQLKNIINKSLDELTLTECDLN